MTNEFTPEQAQRWEAWRRANAVSARHTDRICRAVGATIFLGLLIVLGVAMGRL